MVALRKTRTLAQSWQQWRQEWRQLLSVSPRAYWEKIRYTLRNQPQVHFDLGCDFAAKNLWQDAVFRFRLALMWQPDFPMALYNLGCCYLRQNKRLLAKNAFIRTLKLEPNHADALFMLSALDPACVAPNQRPKRMPAALVKAFFSDMATDYDARELANQYRGGQAVHAVVAPLLTKTHGLSVVDLGCGTGIASRPWRATATTITGVDFAPAMLDGARKVTVGDRPLMDTLLLEDITALETSAADLATADLVLCINVMQFIGDLQNLMATLAARISPGALVACTVEPFAATSGYGVNIETGRFGHTPDYVTSRAQAAGLELAHAAPAQLYPATPSHLFVFRKPIP